MDPATTLFRPGSVSKLFTWTAVMQLVEQGKLDLDRDVNAYLDFKIPPAFGKPITLRNCMTHTAGFEEVGKNLFSDDSVHILSNETFVKEWTPERIYPPGQVPAYSNYATALAGYIVQRVSGEPFEDYIDHHIFEPLGMKHADLPPAAAGGHPRRHGAGLPAGLRRGPQGVRDRRGRAGGQSSPRAAPTWRAS